MNTLKEEVLKLPREEKIELFAALKKDLESGDNDVVQEDDLSREEWAEMYRREKMLENGETKAITAEELDAFLKEKSSTTGK